MIVNIPKEQPMCLYMRCIDDSPSISGKPVIDWVKRGEVYTVYSVAKALNSNSGDVAYYIRDLHGKKIEGHEGIPTWRAERFEPALPNTDDDFKLFIQYLN